MRSFLVLLGFVFFAVGLAQSMEPEDKNEDLGYPFYYKSEKEPNHPEAAFRAGLSIPVWAENARFSVKTSYRESSKVKWREALGLSYQF